MQVSLIKAGTNDASLIHEMQVKSFLPLLNKYEDFATSPANETVDQVMKRLKQISTDYYIVQLSHVPVGAIRIVKKENQIYRISPIFILPEHQGKGVAQKVFSIIEKAYNNVKAWELDTILQEQGNCYLYEKLGYKRKNGIKEINDKLTIVQYEKLMT